MAMERELERLAAVYAESDDDELLLMYERREDLTEVAQAALEQVMKERGIVPGVADAEKETAEDSVGDSGNSEAIAGPALEASEVNLWTFDDAFQASEAIRILKGAGISHRMIDWNAVDPPEASAFRVSLRMGLVVERKDAARAKAVLQSGMGLFPPAETGDPIAGLQGMFPMGQFSLADALEVARALGQARISYFWLDQDRSVADKEAGEDFVEIQVAGTELDRAQELAEARLAELPE